MLCFSWREKAQVRAAPSPLHRGDACCSPHLLSSSAPRAVRLYQGHLGLATPAVWAVFVHVGSLTRAGVIFRVPCLPAHGELVPVTTRHILLGSLEPAAARKPAPGCPASPCIPTCCSQRERGKGKERVPPAAGQGESPAGGR